MQDDADTPDSPLTVQYAAQPIADEDPTQWDSIVDAHDGIEIRFSPLGAGIEELILLDEFETVALKDNIRLQQRVVSNTGISADSKSTATS